MPRKYTEKQVTDAVTGSSGNVSLISKKLGCSWTTANVYIKKYPKAVMALKDEKESILDSAEEQLRKQVNKGEGWAVKFILATIGKSRGYTEKQEIQHSGFVMGKAPVIKRNIVKKA